ncbi:MAG: T9SS C-terminal target domain-containing protein [Bacteroidetes bacterium]|nr:MAG: T9SS C-terminal target domain-containing protein [Bacteroidota bacterium]REK03409.1 MAG: T9SS C-terminal target domain-containing protein [Bacteroidota bacterium]REK34479.1 MAG: T9SS C-terminal target domain-containing protein [Bacteroidota bacterium]REK50403.1 MAG: T9SS C-terminal target domain-containing protein [Bacteroidota bacterium]
MKKYLLSISLGVFIASLSFTASAQRFVSEVFPSASVTSNVVYGNNFTIFPSGVPTAQDLRMDVYEPSGMADPMTERPLILYFHTGSFIPAVANQNPTGGKTDSATVEMCKQFAKRGYVAAAVAYRQGWVPTDPDQDVRTGTLLQAVYRAIQDAKACIRYFRENAMNGGNTYKVDTNTIILVGQGTGGYIALATATLNRVAEIQLTKFLSQSNNPTYGFQIGQPYVNQAALGDFEGFGGFPNLNNPNNSPGHSTAVSFAVNMGGALGDSSWLEAGDVPMVAFHVTNDPFAPFGDGPVFVPTQPPQFVVDVSGSQTVITKANLLGNNDCFRSAGFTDPYTMVANGINGGEDGLFPLLRPVPPGAPGEAGPWEWYDSTALTVYAQAIGLSASAGTAAYMNGLATNPDMSKAKALAYIDTIQNYLNPRIAYCLALPTGLNQVQAVNRSMTVFPNPSASSFTVSIQDKTAKIEMLSLHDITGRTVWTDMNWSNTYKTYERGNLTGGIYILRVQTPEGAVSRRIVLN